MNASRVAVIADSTCYLPAGWAAEWGIQIVPVQVIVAGQPHDETEDAQAQRVAEALAAWQPVTTSRPSPARFLQAYAAAMETGATELVVATLSASMSATYESATLAAKEVDVPVRVVDSRTIAMGLGFAVMSGARAARAGADADHVARAVEERAAAASVFFYVDTLEYLRRGGRVSSARAVVGHALKVKPLLRVVDGHVVPLEQVRTAGRALARLADLAVEAAGDDEVEIAVQHLGSPDRAATLAASLRTRLPGMNVVECAVGGVVGAHVGPGMVAAIVAPVLPSSGPPTMPGDDG
ncbi:MAG: DegV family protein [Actinomycetota bacterium]|nr:DegV family protein [Actinomycetota bacterium]